jgi:hypoxanthine phosphoribosyltransferase
MNEHFLWKSNLEGEHVIIVEDIVDTGHTLHYLKQKIGAQHPFGRSDLLKKPTAYQYHDTLKYEGMSIEDKFVVGYGLDYNGLGRDLDAIYSLKVS